MYCCRYVPICRSLHRPSLVLGARRDETWTRPGLSRLAERKVSQARDMDVRPGRVPGPIVHVSGGRLRQEQHRMTSSSESSAIHPISPSLPTRFSTMLSVFGLHSSSPQYVGSTPSSEYVGARKQGSFWHQSTSFWAEKGDPTADGSEGGFDLKRADWTPAGREKQEGKYRGEVAMVKGRSTIHVT
jgi:hypothetical protein